jgi:hypothetical protein
MDDRPDAGDRPPQGALERAPGERYTGPGDDATAGDPRTPVRGLLLAVLAGAAGAALTVILAGPMAVSAGLLVASLLLGRFVAEGLRLGAGATIPRSRRAWTAIAIAVASVGFAQLGIWAYARWEGGVLSPLDYLAQTFGPLVPLQFAAAALVAWWSAR